MNARPRVVVAMSGGVDSSVVAALLVQQDYEVIGIMMRLWNEPGSQSDNRCCTPDAMALARRVAAKLTIPFYAIDAQEIFYQKVVTYFIDGYVNNKTPNPCLVCNRHIRWEFLFNHALSLDASFLATGHYARVRNSGDGSFQLLRGRDRLKDQSYVLHGLNQRQLAQTLFPLGEYKKSEVRQIAHEIGLPVSERPDSQDLCFLAGSDYRSFLVRNHPSVAVPGPIQTQDGRQLGQHQGLAFYTIGQRKGLGIASSYPLYVLNKDVANNILIVGEAAELGKNSFVANEINWIAGYPPSSRFRAQIKIRYRAIDIEAEVNLLPNQSVQVIPDNPLRDITPGQSVVFYDQDLCLGGGIIQS